MSSQIEFSEITTKVIDYLDEYNLKYMTGYFIKNYIIKSGYCVILYLFNAICLFIRYVINLYYNGMDIQNKVNCMGFTLFTKVKHVRPFLEIIAKAPKFLSWLKGIKLSNVRIENIEIMDVNFFCSTADPNTVDPKCLEFLKIKYNAFDNIDGIVLIHGPCAVICPVIEDESGNEFIMTVEQFRMPMSNCIEEFLVGMCDEHEIENPRTGKTTYRNLPLLNDVLVKELKEKTGLILDVSDPKLFYLGDIMLSPGLLNEKAKIFAWYTKLTNEKIEEMLAKEHVESGTNERIRLHLYPIEEFHKELHRIGDAKTEIAFIRMLNMNEFDPDDDLSDEDYVEETDEDEDDDDDDEDDDDDDEDDDDDDDEDDDDDDEEDEDDDEDDDFCESDHEDMRELYIKEQEEQKKEEQEEQKEGQEEEEQKEEQILYVFVPNDGDEFDELLQIRKMCKNNTDLKLD